VVRLDPGEDVSTPATPDSGGTYEPFQYRTLLQIGGRAGVPYGYLTGDTAKGTSPTPASRWSISAAVSRPFQHWSWSSALPRGLGALDGCAVLSGRLTCPAMTSSGSNISLRLAADQMGLGRSDEGRLGRDPADRSGPEIPHASHFERGYDAEQVDRELPPSATKRALGLISAARDHRRRGRCVE
jgi:hypothetical protein